MSVVRFRESPEGRRADQNFGEQVKAPRVFMVTVDDPATPLVEIANAPGIRWLDPHPEFPTYCVGIAPENDGDPLHYKVTFRYDLLKPQERATLPWDRQDKFSYDGSLTSGPAFIHFNDGNSTPKLIVNSAGDPLEGLMRDEAEWVVQIEGNRRYFMKDAAKAYLNAVNSDTWSGCPAGTVKCMRLGGKQEIEQVEEQEINFWSIAVTLAYREVGWATRTWDVGFNQIVSGKRQSIKDAADQPVSQPVALSNGVKKTEGQPPDMLTFKVYKSLPFSGVFPVLPDP
jgi:hypothetical protein